MGYRATVWVMAFFIMRNHLVWISNHHSWSIFLELPETSFLHRVPENKKRENTLHISGISINARYDKEG